MTLDDIRDRIRRELAELDPSLVEDLTEIERQMRVYIAHMKAAKEAEMMDAARIAATGLTPPYQQMWAARADKLRGEFLDLQSLEAEL